MKAELCTAGIGNPLDGSMYGIPDFVAQWYSLAILMVEVAD